MTISCVIFDIDGVIVDSEQLHFDVLKTLLPEHTNGVTAENLIGLSLEATLLEIGIGVEQHKEISTKIVSLYKTLLGSGYLRHGIRSLILKLIEKQVPFGFVSTAPRDICLANIATLGLRLDQPLISGDDTKRTKPHPDPYLAMLQCLHVSPEQTIVIEDTDLGIKAATEAGIEHVYGWPHALSVTESYSGAYKVINSLNEIDVLKAILNYNLK
ncbi:HAD-IA family hydrolase [Edwardsiella ictaluri]|uniref:HAD-IA family hydrolase n=1 Tax=Edwardsiella ictaluri TaxID=67780 RepID=A0ABY8GIR1_EDWIC|nr:HAD-IA family hydrolase [Edwardsiella ictaluri]ELV7528129.1 HAD-IA family hydrolase [Edwardsiella ictaluri]KMQ78849.1 hydrolase [Edwardsiella ictaluri]KOO55519.1 hydrolase [Edwardsiella ictaluri]WFN97325.1 HAD-IA family hydrolase [Edwardsiella ictaluri]